MFNEAREVEIKRVMEHFEVFIDGKFFSSYDNLEEMVKDMEKEAVAING